MAVVAGVVFFAVRALLALIPALTVTFPIKKWSAAAALAAAAFYLLLSGAEVATQRSFFMTAVVLIAIMVDRRAVTFRTLAVAAMIVLTIAPEALVHPSFQMSFAATLGLVALVQIGMPQLFASPDHSRDGAGGAVGRARNRDAGAGVAGGGACDHALCRVSFSSRDALWRARQSGGDAGGVGAGDAGRAARPGRDAVRLRRRVLAADGIRHRLDDRGGAMGRGIARRDRPHGGVRDRSADRGDRGIILLGCCERRCAGAARRASAMAMVWALAVPQPDILISADGHNVGVRGRDGRPAPDADRQGHLHVKEWLAADADGRLPADPSLARGRLMRRRGLRGADGRTVELSHWRCGRRRWRTIARARR